MLAESALTFQDAPPGQVVVRARLSSNPHQPQEIVRVRWALCQAAQAVGWRGIKTGTEGESAFLEARPTSLTAEGEVEFRRVFQEKARTKQSVQYAQQTRSVWYSGNVPRWKGILEEVLAQSVLAPLLLSGVSVWAISGEFKVDFEAIRMLRRDEWGEIDSAIISALNKENPMLNQPKGPVYNMGDHSKVIQADRGGVAQNTEDSHAQSATSAGLNSSAAIPTSGDVKVETTTSYKLALTFGAVSLAGVISLAWYSWGK